MVGPENESDISICGVTTRGLIDTGSMVSSISQSFYESINPTPELRNISDFGLKITAANGEKIPYIGYILAPVSVSHFGTLVDEIPILIVSNTAYNRKVPSLIGTNIISRCSDTKCSSTSVPDQWKMAFDSLVNDNIRLKLPTIMVSVYLHVKLRLCMA